MSNTTSTNNKKTEQEIFYEIYGEKYLEQLELEAQSKEQAEELLRVTYNKARYEDKTGGNTALGSALIREAWTVCNENILSMIEKNTGKKAGAQKTFAPFIQRLLFTDYYNGNKEELAAILTTATLAQMIDTTLSGEITLQKVIDRVSDTITDEADLKYHEQHTDKLTQDALMRGMSHRCSEKHRRALLRAYLRNTTAGKDAIISWRKKEVKALGAELVSLVITGSGYWLLKEDDTKQDEIINKTKYKKEELCVQPAQWILDTWQHNLDILASHAHQLTPTIIPPKPWTTQKSGGYYGDNSRFCEFVRLHGFHGNSWSKKYEQELQKRDLSYVMEAVNNLQNTPYRINNQILQFVKEQWENGGGYGVPYTKLQEMLPNLPETATKEEIDKHKQKQVQIIQKNNKTKGHQIRLYATLALAERFSEYEEIYFPHNVDFRGRIYPMTAMLSPQSNDLGKSLLMFAQPKPCTKEDAWRWLAIQGANCAGKDKLHLQERVDWVVDNTENILKSGQNPKDNEWWYDISKDDAPLQFLAFCFAWVEMAEYKKTHNGSIIGWRCGIPYAMDASCSGTQHYSAILRDNAGGEKVNLTPSTQRHDVYQLVADKVNDTIQRDSMSGSSDDVVVDDEGIEHIIYGTKTHAQLWATYGMRYCGVVGIDRSVVKKPVMTLSYGADVRTFRDQLLYDTISTADSTLWLNTAQKIQSAQYLAEVIMSAARVTVNAAVEGMEWLQELAREITKNKKDEAITWTTPNGFLVSQSYSTYTTETQYLRTKGRRYRIYTQHPTDKMDTKRQKRGIAPNFIHSLDAAHMQRVISEMAGYNLWMVHDSFATDISSADILYRVVRTTFCGMYNNGKNYLLALLQDMEGLLSEKQIQRLKKTMPKIGTLNVEGVLDSEFAFS